VPSDPGRRICPSIGGPVSPAACQVWATARVAEREPHMMARAELVICEQSIERDFAWASRFRRLVKGYERLPETVGGCTLSHSLAFSSSRQPASSAQVHNTLLFDNTGGSGAFGRSLLTSGTFRLK
jgi:hypothetical protein